LHVGRRLNARLFRGNVAAGVGGLRKVRQKPDNDRAGEDDLAHFSEKYFAAVPHMDQ
jgi:hypothetical protein